MKFFIDRQLSKKEKTFIDKELHKYSSGNRKDGGKKIVVNLQTEMVWHFDYKTLWQGWLIRIWWEVGYLEKDENYVCTKLKEISLWLSSINDKRTPQKMFNSISKYKKKFDFPSSRFKGKLKIQ